MQDTVLQLTTLNGTQISFPVKGGEKWESLEKLPLPKKEVGGQEGNQNGLRFKTLEERQEFYKAYADHVSKGFSDESFRYKGSGIKTLQNYREIFSLEFPTELIEDANAARLKFWETIGINGTIGVPVTINGKQYGKFNAASWQFNMQNRFKWKSREDVTTNDKDIDTSPKVIIQTTDPRKHE